MAMSLVVYAGASRLAATQLLAFIALTVPLLRAHRGLGAGTAAAEKGPIPVVHNERLLAGAVAIVVAWRWRLTFATIASGLIALHLFSIG